MSRCSASVVTIVLLAAFAFCAFVSSLCADSFPVSGKGDIEFQADCSTFLGPNNSIEAEFYVKVRSDQLNFEKRGKRAEARVLLTIAFVNELGDVYETKTREFKPDLDDKPARDDSNLFMVRYPITPSAKKVLITLEDLRARRRGILYLFTKERKRGVAEADVQVSEPLAGTLSMSDIQFAWSVNTDQPGGSRSFVKSGLEVIPNPSRIYGLRRGTLSAYFEVYDQTDFARNKDRVFYEVVSSVLGVNREPMLSDTQKVVSSSRQWVQTVAMDISELPAGSYWLRVEAWQEEGQNRILREREFSLLWYDASWRRTDSDVLDEAGLFLRDKQLKEFKRLNTGERESFLENFWKSLDPTSGTASNEIKEEFDRRVAYANTHFSFFTRGMLSDRGRVYIKYGEPDLIEKQVVPTSGDAADILLTEGPIMDNIERKLSPKQVGNDRRSYEIWIYNMRGKMLFPEQEQTMTQTLGMKFMFVDDSGVGNYILESTSDRSSKYH